MSLLPQTAPAEGREKRNKPVKTQHIVQSSEFIHSSLMSWVLSCFIWMGVALDSPILIACVLVYILDTVLLVLVLVFFQLRFSPWSGQQCSFVATHLHGHCYSAPQPGTCLEVRSCTCFWSAKQHSLLRIPELAVKTESKAEITHFTYSTVKFCW